jgi:hypothetical protein
MTEDKSREAFDRLSESLDAEHEDVTSGKAFGMPALKVRGKMFAGYFNGDMTFKLSGESHREALAIPGAQLFDAGGMNRPMKEWVQVPGDRKEEWPRLAEAALAYVVSNL